MAQESAYFTVDKGFGLHDTKLLKRALDALPGVKSVSVNEEQGKLCVDYDSTGVRAEQIQAKMEELGYLPREYPGIWPA